MLKSLKKISQVGATLYVHQETNILLNINRNSFSYSHRPFINIRKVDKSTKSGLIQEESEEFKYQE